MFSGNYINIDHNDKFHIVGRAEKLHYDDSEVDTLDKITEVIERGLSYSGEIQDQYSVLPQNELWSKLQATAKLIHEDYDQQVNKVD